jgi:hypothetical protein
MIPFNQINIDLSTSKETLKMGIKGVVARNPVE